jgi:peptidoglycan hydrolase-like protein with peptidoglycan-binding domain
MDVVDAPRKVTTGRPMSPVGIVVHHTASNHKADPDDVIDMCIRGVNKVPGPLYNYMIKRDGTIVCLSEKFKANHAGRGSRKVMDRLRHDKKVVESTVPGRSTFNASLYGVAIINDGLGEDVPDVQMDALARFCAFLCDGHGWNPLSRILGHKEYTTRKIDPVFNMKAFRHLVDTHTVGKPVRLSPTPEEQGEMIPFPGVLRKGSRSSAVKFVQTCVGATGDGIFGRGTRAKVIKWQRAHGLAADGIVGPATWAAMKMKRTKKIVQPTFY